MSRLSTVYQAESDAGEEVGAVPMVNDDTTRRMEVVLAIHDRWQALGGAADDPAHSAWLEQATMWAIGRRAELAPHPTLFFGGERSTHSARKLTRRAGA